MTFISRRTWLQGAGAAAGCIAMGRSVAGRAGSRSSVPRKKTDLVHMLSGVHNFLTTPFTADLELNADGLRRNVADHARGNPEQMTIVVSGGLGELFSLSVAEHKNLVEAAVAGAAGKLPVVAGVGGGYKNMLEMAFHAEQAGATAIIIYAYPLACNNSEGAFQYIHNIARSVKIGTMAFPCAKGDFWPEVLQSLAELPNFMGFKDPSGDVEVGQPLVGDEFLWLAEGESHAEKTLAVGGQAYTTAVSTFVPQACLEFLRHGIAGNVDEMKKVREARIDPVVKVRSVKPGYGLSGIKVALDALGRTGGLVRPPEKQVAEEDRSTIAKIAQQHAEELA